MAAPEKYTEIELKLGEPLSDLLGRRRADGLSWRRIAMEITARTQIDIAGETLRVWHQGITPIAAKAGAA